MITRAACCSKMGVRQIRGRLTGIAGVSPAACAVGQRQSETRPHFELHPSKMARVTIMVSPDLWTTKREK